MSSPRVNRASGASIHASALMLRSRVGVSGRSSVWLGVSSTGRSSAGSALPASIDVLLEAGALGPDGGVVAVARQHESVGVEGREEALVDGPDDLVEVAARVA